jgi:hypothetical protein
MDGDIRVADGVECNGSDLKGVERVVSAQYKSSSKNSGIFRRLVTRGEWSLAHWAVRSRESSRNPCTAPFSGEETSVKTPSSFSLEGGGAHQCLSAAGRSVPDASVCPATRILDEPEPTREVSPRTPARARLSACAGVHPTPHVSARQREWALAWMIKTAAAGSCGGVVFI